MKPKVSVIMGIYNCMDTLTESIESIIAQTYENWELIMCDDASTDQTYEIAKHYAAQYTDKIILIRNNSNLRLAGTLNHCLKHVTGKYVARMDGDDLSLPDRFERQVEFLERNSDYQVVGTAMMSFDEEGIRGIRRAAPAPQPQSIVRSTPFCHATIMMRAEAYRVLGGYRVSKQTRRMEDLDLWLRFYQYGFQGYNLQEPLYMVRDDSNAYKRRKLTYALDASTLVYQACRRLKLPLKCYLYVVKPIIAALTPGSIMSQYHKRQLTKQQSLNS